MKGKSPPKHIDKLVKFSEKWVIEEIAIEHIKPTKKQSARKDSDSSAIPMKTQIFI